MSAMSSLIWTAVAVALVIGLIKTTVKLLKFVFTVLLIGAVLLLLSSVGIVLF